MNDFVPSVWRHIKRGTNPKGAAFGMESSRSDRFHAILTHWVLCFADLSLMTTNPDKFIKLMISKRFAVELKPADDV